MSTTERQVRLLAETLDSQGKSDQPITVVGTRANLRPHFPSEKRGGPLRCGAHELVIVARPPKPTPLENLDWVGEVA